MGSKAGTSDRSNMTYVRLASAIGPVRRLLRRPVVVVAFVAVWAGMGVYALRSGEEASYAAVTRFAVVPSDVIRQGIPADLVESVSALDRPIVTATANELLQSGMVAEAAGDAAGVPTNDLDRYDFTATQVPGSAVLRLVVTGPVADTAAALAQTTRDQANTLLSDYIGAFEIQPIDRASVRALPSGPNPERDALTVSMAVAVAGVALVLLVGGRRDLRAEAAAVAPQPATPANGASGPTRGGIDDVTDLADRVAALQKGLTVNGTTHIPGSGRA